jgi:hypothetical protein
MVLFHQFTFLEKVFLVKMVDLYGDTRVAPNMAMKVRFMACSGHFENLTFHEESWCSPKMALLPFLAVSWEFSKPDFSQS